MKKMMILIAVLVVLAVTLLLFAGKSLFAPRYKVICDDWFEGAKRSYPEGATVRLWFSMIATDTDYTFYVDGQRVNASGYDDCKGYCIEFIMPAHDVTVTCDSWNSMVYVPEEPEEQPDEGPEEEPVMLVDYYQATAAAAEGGGYYELVLYATEDPEMLQLTEYSKTDEEAAEQSRSCDVPAEVLAQCMEIIEKHELAQWAELPDGVSEDGLKLVCRFRGSDGVYYRAANECMPENGREVLEGIGAVLRSYMEQQP